MALPFLDLVFNHDAVLRILIRKRCREAENYQKKLVVYNLAVGLESNNDKNRKKSELYALFPPRRQWVHLGNDSKRHIYTSRERNEHCLYLTVKREERNMGKHPEWYRQLSIRISNILQGARTDKKLFSKPNVTIIEKKRNEKERLIECRPICLFRTLDQQITASLFNRAFSKLFDPFFYEKSLAFRPHKMGENGMAHLNAIKMIKEFRKENGNVLWVAECDMIKFYDTLDHDIIKKRFNQLLLWSKQKGFINNIEKRILKNAIYSYVDCFRFYKDVYKYNNRPNHLIWKKIKNSNGYTKVIKWVYNDICARREKKWPHIYRTKYHYKYQLGVPQGGALSGVIANVMMHFVDIKLKQYWNQNPKFLYIRFCDDMIMMGVNHEDVSKAYGRYSDTVDRNHLYIHPPVSFSEQKMAKFWDGKTRPPYQWGKNGKDVFPWITFVGYDINWEADTRVRKTTLRKEIKKQYDKRIEIEHLLSKKSGRNPQWSKQFISSSVHKRLIGMSVGRVPIWNYESFDNKYSWAKAFTELTDNPWSRSQLKLLDKHRNLMMKRLDRVLLNLDYKEIRPSDRMAYSDAIWYFGKPFSYYGQVLKKWK